MNHFISTDARVIYRTGTKRGEKKEFVRSFATVIINLPFKPWLALQLRVWPMEMPGNAVCLK